MVSVVKKLLFEDNSEGNVVKLNVRKFEDVKVNDDKKDIFL